MSRVIPQSLQKHWNNTRHVIQQSQDPCRVPPDPERMIKFSEALDALISGSCKRLWSAESLKRQERRRVRTWRSHKEKKKKKPADGRRGLLLLSETRLKPNLKLSGGALSLKGLFYKITEEVETQAAPLFDYKTGYIWLSLLRFGRWKSIGSHFYPTCPTQRSRIRKTLAKSTMYYNCI